jgi:hypothetical protein
MTDMGILLTDFLTRAAVAPSARAEAQSISNASSGKGCNAAMGALLEEYGFGNALERHRSQVTRADLLRCMD